MRDGSSIVATKARAVSWPTPEKVISRRQAAGPSPCAACLSRSRRPPSSQCSVSQSPHGGEESRNSFTRLREVFKGVCGHSDLEHDRKATNLIF
jgi:hypothetical protein